jgi:hypothetical protein
MSREAVYEVVYQTDEAYYTLAHFADRGDADEAARVANEVTKGRSFEVKERVLFTAGDQPYRTLADVKHELESSAGEYVTEWWDVEEER